METPKTLCRYFPDIQFREIVERKELYLPHGAISEEFIANLFKSEKIALDSEQQLFRHQLYHKKYFAEKIEPEYADDILKYYKFRYSQLFYIREDSNWKPLLFWPSLRWRTDINPYFEHNTGSFLLEHAKENEHYYNYHIEIFDRIPETEYKIFVSDIYREIPREGIWKLLDSSPVYVKRLPSGWHELNEINNPVLTDNVLSVYKNED